MSVAGFMIIRGLEQRHLQQQFSQVAERSTAAVEQRVHHTIEILRSIRHLYEASHEVERQEFRVFVEDILQHHPELHALEWVPRVGDAERAAYEQTMRDEGDQDVQLIEQDAQGRFVRAGSRETYFPIHYVEPLDANRMMLGFDYASSAFYRAAMNRARETGEPAATAWFTLAREPGQIGCLIFLPIFRQHLMGFASAVFRMDRLIDAGVHAAGEGVALSISDEESDPVASQGHRRRGIDVEWRTTLDVAGARWRILCRATPEFMRSHGRYESWLFLVMGLLATLLGSASLRLLSRRSVHIERLVLERTAKLRRVLEDLEKSKQQLEMQDQLLEATIKRLQELAALKDEFVAKVSHELRTPLTSIKEGLNLLIDNALGGTTADQQDFLKTMDGDVDRLAELISNMLDLSKIEAGRLHLLRTRVSVKELLEAVLRSYKPLVGQRTIRVECPEASYVFADRNRLIQVLTNLMSNALKVTPEEEGAMTFTVTEQDGMVAVGLTDNGPGIAAEDFPKLFQKFSQLDRSRTKGTGLGLVVCKELLEAHGGRMEVQSELGRGSTFTAFLPAYTDVFALQESFKELTDLIPTSEGQTVCCLAIQADPLLDHGATAAQRWGVLERLMEEVRSNLHRGDIVLVREPSWIVVLALVRPQDVPSIVNRLRQTALNDLHAGIGIALYLGGSRDAAQLFEYAASHVDRAPVVQDAGRAGGVS